MKKLISGHALALHKVTIDGCAGEVELEVYEGSNGGYFALDCSFLEQVCTDDLCYIPDPYNEGMYIQLVDSIDEVESKTVHEDTNDHDALVTSAITQISNDIENRDFTAIAELLEFVPAHILKSYLPED